MCQLSSCWARRGSALPYNTPSTHWLGTWRFWKNQSALYCSANTAKRQLPPNFTLSPNARNEDGGYPCKYFRRRNGRPMAYGEASRQLMRRGWCLSARCPHAPSTARAAVRGWRSKRSLVCTLTYHEWPNLCFNTYDGIVIVKCVKNRKKEIPICVTIVLKVGRGWYTTHFFVLMAILMKHLIFIYLFLFWRNTCEPNWM